MGEIRGVAEFRTSARPLFDTFLTSEDVERFVEEVRGDDPELARYLRIEGKSPATSRRAG